MLIVDLISVTVMFYMKTGFCFNMKKKKIEIVSSEVSFLGSTYFSIWLVCVAIVR